MLRPSAAHLNLVGLAGHSPLCRAMFYIYWVALSWNPSWKFQLSNMDSCTIEGVADFYGLGIRLGFYAQWSALLLANFLGVAEEVPGIRVSFTVFVAATFLALVMEASHSALSHVDIYITLLVCFGYSFSMIPACSWTLLTEF